MGLSRQKYWSGLPYPPLGDLPHLGIKPISPVSPTLQVGSFLTEPPRKPLGVLYPLSKFPFIATLSSLKMLATWRQESWLVCWCFLSPREVFSTSTFVKLVTTDPCTSYPFLHLELWPPALLIPSLSLRLTSAPFTKSYLSWQQMKKQGNYPCVKLLVTQACLTLYDPVDRRPPGSFIHRILQARILEWVAILFSRGSSQPRDWTRVSCIAGRSFTVWASS